MKLNDAIEFASIMPLNFGERIECQSVVWKLRWLTSFFFL